MVGIKKLKKWLASIVTVLLVIALFGLTFVTLGITTISPRFWLELTTITIATITVRFFWYDDGEDKCSLEPEMLEMKSDYAKLVDENVKNQEHFEEFLVHLNQENRKKWIEAKIGCRNETNTKKFNKKKAKIQRKAGRKVKPITSTQVLTRSNKYTIITAKDYNKSSKVFFQITAVIISVCSSVILSLIAYEELKLNWTNAFRYVSYLFSIGWALLRSYTKGYKNYKIETVDHISRVTMIVNRYIS